MTTGELRRSLWAILTRPLPEGGSLPEDVWRRRHTAMLALLALHAAGLATIAALTGADQPTATFAGGAPAFFAVAAAVPWLSRKVQTGLVAIGLTASSALLVHLTGASAESYFHVFVVLALVALYQDWLPILVALGAITLHNFALDAGLHYTGFAVAASVVGIIAWRLNERERTLARQVLASTVDGMYGRDLEGKITFVNDALTRMVGKQPAALVGRSDHEALGHASGDGSLYPPGGCPACSAIRVATGTPSEGVLASAAADPIIIEYAATPIQERGQTVGAVVTLRDQTERDQLTRKALHDQLTGLPNRALLDEHLHQALARLERRPDRMVAVFFLDLDRFKVVNDSLGHAAGDVLLVEVARRLQDAVRTEDTVARFGGDEFVVLCEDFVDERDVVRISERLIRGLTAPITIEDNELTVTTSIGVAMTSDASVSPEALVRDADAAMYRAKELGRNRYELFDDALRVKAVDRLRIESELRRALTTGELVVHYQPKVDLGNNELVGVEALVRWDHPERGLVPPADFIPVAEETGLIGQVGAWVLEDACEQVQRWRMDHAELRRLKLAVNLSSRQLDQPDLVQTVDRILTRTGFPPSLLVLEITESVLMGDAEETIRVLEALKRLGVQLAVDDFGTGYSSLSYLTRFPIDILKVDRSFVNNLSEQADSWSIVAAVIGLSRSLGLSTVAEGVEEESQAAVLRSLGCELAQGFHFSRPGPAEDIRALLLAPVQSATNLYVDQAVS